MKLTTYLVVPFLAVLPGCLCFSYPKRPTITIRARNSDPLAEVGDYAPDYTNQNRDVSSANLFVIEDPNFGCPGYNNSHSNFTFPRDGPVVIMLPYLGANSPCHEFFKARTARSEYGAVGLIYRYDRSDIQGGQLANRPGGNSKLSSITVVTMELGYIPGLVYQQGSGFIPRVSIIAHYHQFQTSQTFYFIVFAFCILMLLSCLWFVMSYVKRCHYNVQRRRRRIRSDNETRRVLNRLPVKSFKAVKNSEDPTCAVCLEAFHNNDAIRILPCKHEFHKKCVDPWLKIKQNCPMCKSSITSTPPPSNTHDRAAAAGSGGPAANEDDLSMVTLRHDGEVGSVEMGQATNDDVAQETNDVAVDIADDVSNQTSDTSSDLASDSPLLTEQPSFEIAPYSPQVELNLSSMLPSTHPAV